MTAMLDTSSRLVRLLSLLQARRFWPGPALAEALEITPRTLRRDVDRLRRLGYPVESSGGVAGGYRLGAGARLPPLMLEEEEALAVAVALQTASGSLAGMEGAEAVAVWLAGMGVDFEVEEGAEFAAHLGSVAERLRRAVAATESGKRFREKHATTGLPSRDDSE